MSLGITGKFKKVSENLSLRDSFGSLVLICLGGVSLTVLFQIILFFNYVKLSTKPPPTLVQLSNGQSITVKGIGNLERTDESIQKFTRDILSLTFTWTGHLPTTDAAAEGNYQKDTGVSITLPGKTTQNGKITTAAYEASFAFELNFRQEFLKSLAELVPESVFKSDTQMAFIPIYIDKPMQVAPGKWKVIVISNLMMLKNGQPMGELVRFNKEIYVRAVVPPNYDFLPPETKSKSLASQVMNMRQSGLEIYAISDYKQQDLQ
ncbi:conserved hypothetical protein (plasmid) [Gloeothece citriformis PCC 7424]|uniref:Uncharacterized protein n=1 Tax=Gloeothece citriformis (strain PCC 7424) TaxID=65393 RepID=B7KML0_GLOC7|nr:hypothetical protein [Gloeothece citriformis]ACK74032.1 conserved hypothetical protein [Gloeothece citriformis PCC 7424]